MTRLDFRDLDPVDRAAPEPDGEALLAAILASEAPPPRRRGRARGPLRLRAVAAAGVCAAAAGVALAMPGGTGTDVVAAAYDAVHPREGILHYTQRWTDPGSALWPRQDMGTVEVWQAADGSRQRVLSRFEGLDGVHEAVVDPTGSRTYVPGRDEIIEYRERAGAPAAPGGVGRRELGDPRTLLARAQRGDERVEVLGEATVRGIPVLQFRVGECRIGPRRRTGPGAYSQEMRRALVVSVARDDYTPVRVEEPPCVPPPADAATTGLRMEQLPGTTIDYLEFEVLPATEANLRQLELSPHPGAEVLDGEDVDAAEERAETPSPTPAPAPSRPGSR